MPLNQQKCSDVARLLSEIEAELRRLDWWAGQQPSTEALASTAPFCADTLSLEEWLQFVLIPRMRHLIDAGMPLPGDCGIAPMAEVAWVNRGNSATALLELLASLDRRLGQ